jgi:hypothetical protein
MIKNKSKKIVVSVSMECMYVYTMYRLSTLSGCQSKNGVVLNDCFCSMPLPFGFVYVLNDLYHLYSICKKM